MSFQRAVPRVGFGEFYVEIAKALDGLSTAKHCRRPSGYRLTGSHSAIVIRMQWIQLLWVICGVNLQWFLREGDSPSVATLPTGLLLMLLRFLIELSASL